MTPSSTALHGEARRAAMSADGSVSSAPVYIDKAKGTLLWDSGGRE